MTIEIMIVVLINIHILCVFSEDYDQRHNPHKMLSLHTNFYSPSTVEFMHTLYNKITTVQKKSKNTNIRIL